MTDFTRNPTPISSDTLPLAPRPATAFLEIRRGAAKQKLRPVAPPVYLIGRSSACDLVLADAQFPEVYAYLLTSERRISLRRVGEGPETTVDGRPVEAAELFHGDRLRMGPYEFRLHLNATPPDPEKPTRDVTDEKPQVARPRRHAQPTPHELVRALLSEIRARLASPMMACTPANPAPKNRRDAA